MMKNLMMKTAAVALGIVLAVAPVIVPADARADTVRLKDGTTLKGKVVSFADGVLVFETSFGAEVRLERERIVAIDFTDSLPLGTTGAPKRAEPEVSESSGTGRVAVTFKDRNVSSKVEIRRRVNWDELLQANWIMQALIVDGDTAYTRIDTTMDKTIYKGIDRQFKNDFEMEDMDVEVPVGLHQFVVVVRNVGADEYPDAFQSKLDLFFTFDNVEIYPERTTRLGVGIDRGRFRTGEPAFYRVD